MPHATALAREVGLGDELTSPTGATAAVWYDGLHPIPDGLLLGVPADLAAPVARAGLLSWRGKAARRARAAAPAPRSPTTRSAPSSAARFGDEVHERLVDALVGSIYAADTDRFSLAMVPAARRPRRARAQPAAQRPAAARRPRPPATGPVFHAPRGGMAALVDAVAGRGRAAAA